MMWERFSNPLAENPRVKRWVTELMEQRAALSRALGVPLGELLGCGNWGCVVDSTPPWVVKFTIDPNEGPIWSKIQRLLDEEDYGQGGLVRVERIARIEPGVMYGGRRKKVVAVVREAVAPVFHYVRGRWGHSLDRTALTPHTKTALGIDPAEDAALGRRGSVVIVIGDDWVTQTPRVVEFQDNIDALQNYNYYAGHWFSPQDWETTRSEVSDRLERIVNRFYGPIGGPIGESLSMLLSNEVVLRDVHLMNIGWRIYGKSVV